MLCLFVLSENILCRILLYWVKIAVRMIVKWKKDELEGKIMGISINWQTRVSPELDAKTQSVADSMGLTKQELIRFIVAQYVDSQTKTMNMLQNSIEGMLRQGVDASPGPQFGGAGAKVPAK